MELIRISPMILSIARAPLLLNYRDGRCIPSRVIVRQRAPCEEFGRGSYKMSISMSSTQSTPSKHLYILWARDLTDAECWSRRQAASPEHLDNVNTNWEPGFMRVAGVTVPPEYEHLPFQQKQWNGSVLILCAESLDVAWGVVKGDAFYRHDVWDKDSIVLMPFLPVTPIPDHAPLVLPGQQ